MPIIIICLSTRYLRRWIITGLSNEIYQAALACGYDNCGIIAPEDLTGSKERLQERMGKVPSSAAIYGGMRIYEPVKDRFPWAKSIIVLTAEHGKYRYPPELRGRYAKAFFLSPEEGHTDSFDHVQFERWLTEHHIRWDGVDAVPLRYAAMKAGLGIIRRNNFFYTERGSFVSLTAYIVDCECTLYQQTNIRPCSEACTLCRKACKTGALCDAYTMDPSRCVSFWTTFGKGNIPGFLEESMFEEWICGCDNCQDACPYNRKHNWDEGNSFSNLEEIAAKLVPEKLLEQTDTFIEQQIIPKTADHLMPGDSAVLRHSAERAVRNRKIQLIEKNTPGQR